MAPHEEAAYTLFYREVELHWSWRREKQIIVSPVEFETIETWYEAEIPLAVILRAIDLFIEAKAKAKRQRNYLLNHVDGTVQKVFAEYQLLHVDDDEDTDLLATKKAKLIRKLKRVAKEIPSASDCINQTVTHLAGLDTKNAVSFETLETELQRLDKMMLSQLAALLSKEDEDSIREEAESLLKEEEDPVFFAKLIDDGVRFHFGVPRLTILG